MPTTTVTPVPQKKKPKMGVSLYLEVNAFCHLCQWYCWNLVRKKGIPCLVVNELMVTMICLDSSQFTQGHRSQNTLNNPCSVVQQNFSYIHVKKLKYWQSGVKAVTIQLYWIYHPWVQHPQQPGVRELCSRALLTFTAGDSGAQVAEELAHSPQI